MVRKWFSAEKGKGEGFAVVRFVRLAAAAAMSCFFGCLRIKDSRSHMSAPQKRPMSHDNDSLSSLLLSDDDSLRNRGKARKPQPEEADVGELRYEAMFLKACGTLPETPLEIRKASRNWVDTSAEKEESLNFNSWLPTASIEKLKLEKQPDQSPPHVKYCEEWVTEAGCLLNTPSSCTADHGHNPRRNSVSSIQSSDTQNVTTPTDMPDNETHSSAIPSASPIVFDTSVRGKNKSVRFECQSDNSVFSSETSSQRSKEFESADNSSESKPSPYPTPLKLTDEMQTPGTVFPGYSNNMADRKANRIRSQYVYSVFNPIENSIIWEDFDLKNENSDSENLRESGNPNDEEPLISIPLSGTSINNLSVGKDRKDEASFSWFKPHSDNENVDNDISDENSHFGRTPGDRPILGTVATHWNDEDSSYISPKWWDGNGIPNTTNKYKEDQKVSWHATPFEERLEKALCDGTFVSQRKPVSGTLPVEFKETEVPDTVQSSAHIKSIVSF